MKFRSLETVIFEAFNLYAHFITMIPHWLFNFLFPETVKPDDYAWSKIKSFWQPKVRLVDGSWSGNGVMWRRRRESDNRWEYQQDPETAEEALERVI